MGVRLRLLTQERIDELGFGGAFYPHPSGMFALSKEGEVLGRMGRVLKKKDQGKYHIVSYYTKCGKVRHKYVHRLMLEVFYPELCDEEVNHKDGDRYNNALDNLEWVDRKANVAHAREIGLIWNYPAKGQQGFQSCRR